ncbi:MAG: sulfotransferase [Proteobacteria bacterium]|nr:sulfotransferase [Pseudomonadota bacterium]
MTPAERANVARSTFEKAVALHRQGALAEAERLYRQVLRLAPGHPGVLHGLGIIALNTQRAHEAFGLLSEAAGAAPKNGPIHSDLGKAGLASGRYVAAVSAFETALCLRPGDSMVQIGLADALSVLGHIKQAEEAFAALSDTLPAPAQFGLGGLAMQRGDSARARTHFERAVALAPRELKYYRALAEAARFVPDDPRLAPLQALERGGGLDTANSIELHFALAKAYDDLGQFDDAFVQLRSGNGLHRRRIAYDERSISRHFDDIAATFTKAFLEARSRAGAKGSRPIFVVGMPRSGTTLVEQILASHPEVHGAGELLTMSDIVADVPGYPQGTLGLDDSALSRLGRRYLDSIAKIAPAKARVVDKLPANFRHLGLIHLLLPDAKIIHLRRDPLDTCFSCYSKLFLGGLNFTYDLGELGRYHRMHDKLMSHWRQTLPTTALMEIEYESLVGTLEAEARRLIAFCGLAWDPRCLAFSSTDRPVRTLSQAQVRQPLYSTAIGRWKTYEKHLGPLIDALG